MTKTNEERLLVCVEYGIQGKRLIQRSAYISSQLHAPMTILVLDTLSDKDFINDKEVDMAIFQEIADKVGANLKIERTRPANITKIIIHHARKLHASQIIIGEKSESFWTNVNEKSIIDVILKRSPFADLYIIPKERSAEAEDWQFERGIHAYLINNTDGKTYQLKFEPEDALIKGIFFRSLNTDFNTGLFAFKEDGKIIEVRVDDGIVNSLKDIDDET